MKNIFRRRIRRRAWHWFSHLYFIFLVAAILILYKLFSAQKKRLIKKIKKITLSFLRCFGNINHFIFNKFRIPAFFCFWLCWARQCRIFNIFIVCGI